MVESVASVDKPISPEAEQMQSSICSTNNSNSNKEARKSSRLNEAIMSKLAAASNPSMPVSADLVQLRLAQFFPNFETPSHPPYSSMIQQAILELKEEGGSSEAAISRFIEKEYESLPWAHASFLSHHLKKLSRNQEILCANNDRYMLRGDAGNFADGEEIHHGLKIEDRDGKEDQTLVQANGREAEVTDGWSGVKSYQTEESSHRFRSKRQTVKLNRNATKAFLQRILEFKEENEGKQESVGEIRGKRQNLSGQIEVAEEIDQEKAKLAKVGQKSRRGSKRKQPVMTQEKIKVLKDNIPQPVVGEKKKVTEEQQQHIKGASGVNESVVVMSGEQQKQQLGKMISEECSRQDQQIDIRMKVQVFPCDGQDGKNLKWKRRKNRKRRKGIRKPQLTWNCSMNALKESKKEALQHECEEERKPHYREKELIIVCALPPQQQPQSRTCIYEHAHKLQRDLVSASLESMESGQKPKLCSPRRKPSKAETQKSSPKAKTSFGMGKNSEVLEEKQEQEFPKEKNLLKFKIKTKAIFGGEEAAVSLPIDLKDSKNVPLGLELHGREHQNKQIKVYVRRKVITCQVKESEASSNLPTNSGYL